MKYMEPKAEIIEFDTLIRTDLINSGDGDENNVPSQNVDDFFGNN